MARVTIHHVHQSTRSAALVGISLEEHNLICFICVWIKVKVQCIFWIWTLVECNHSVMGYSYWVQRPTVSLHSIESDTSIYFNLLSYTASSFKRFSFVIAILDAKGYWRLRYRCVISSTNGLLVFKLRSTLQIQNGTMVVPPQYQFNSVILLGIKPSLDTFKIGFKIFANQDGNIDDEHFNGYYSFATWKRQDGGRDQLLVDEKIDAETKKPKRKFNQKIQPIDVSLPLASFHSQRFDRV